MSKEQKLIEVVADILECEVSEISLETELGEPEWDSLAIVSFMAEADSVFGVSLSPKKVGEAVTVKGLLELI